MRNLLLCLMLTGSISCYAADVVDEAQITRKALLVTSEFQKLCRPPVKAAADLASADRLQVMKINLAALNDSGRLELGQNLQLTMPRIEGFDAEKAVIMDLLQPIVDGVKACTDFLGYADYEARIAAFDEETRLQFARDFTAYKDLLEGNAMRKIKIAGICNKILEKQKEKDRLAERQKKTAVRSDETLQRFAAAARASGNTELAETVKKEAKKLAAELMRDTSSSSNDFVLQESGSAESIAAAKLKEEPALQAKKLADEERKKAFRARLAKMSHCLTEDATVQQAAQEFADEQAKKKKEEKLVMLRPKLDEATACFEKAQETREQAEARAKQEADALDFARKSLPKNLVKIPVDARNGYLAWGKGLSAGLKAGDAAAIETLNSIALTHGFTDSTPFADIERKVEELLDAGNHEIGFKVLKYLAMKYVGNAESSKSMLMRAQEGEAEADEMLKRLEAEYQAI